MSDQLVQTGELDKSAIARWARRAWNAEAEIDRLRALNAEMREALQRALMRMEALCDCSEISGCQDAARRASIRAILAKSQEAAS